MSVPKLVGDFFSSICGGLSRYQFPTGAGFSNSAQNPPALGQAQGLVSPLLVKGKARRVARLLVEPALCRMPGKVRPRHALECSCRFGSSIHFVGIPLQRLARQIGQAHPTVLFEHGWNDEVVRVVHTGTCGEIKGEEKNAREGTSTLSCVP